MKTSKNNSLNKDRAYSNHKRKKDNFVLRNIAFIIFAISFVVIAALMVFFMSVAGKKNYERQKSKEVVELIVEKEINNSDDLSLIEKTRDSFPEIDYSSMSALMERAEVFQENDSNGNILAVGWKYSQRDKSYEAIFKMDKFGVKHETLKIFVSGDITMVFEDFNLVGSPVIESSRCKVDCYYFFNTSQYPKEYMNMRNLNFNLLSNSSITLNEVEDGEILETYLIPRLDNNYDLIQSSLEIPRMVAGENFWDLINKMRKTTEKEKRG